MIKVLLTDKNSMFRAGMKQILSDVPDIELIDEAEDRKELQLKMSGSDYDVLVLDLSQLKEDGIYILRKLTKKYPETKVLISGLHPEDQYAVWLINAGASGYVKKNKIACELVVAIQKIARGGMYISPTLTRQKILDIDNGNSKLPHEKLSPREFQVMRLIAAGKARNEIALELAISLSAICTYRKRLLEKMKMKNTAEVIFYAVRYGLLNERLACHLRFETAHS